MPDPGPWPRRGVTGAVIHNDPPNGNLVRPSLGLDERIVGVLREVGPKTG
jgi:hypothetical protein